MAELAELSLGYRLFLQAYRWRRIDPVPWTTLALPLEAARVALVTSAGLTAPRQPPFDAVVRGGDPSFRIIPGDVAVASLTSSHRSATFEHAGLDADPNLAFPLDRLRELAAAGRIGSSTARHLSFMGSLTAVGRFVRESLPAMAEILLAERAQVALLVPV